MHITEPALLLRLNELYREGMSAEELYEATRGQWRVGMRREQARYAFAVFQGVVREVYRSEAWSPAGATRYRTRDLSPDPDRWEFTGVLAETPIRARYIGQSVSEYFATKSQNPIAYVNC